jgi:hypothetical protein
MTIADLLAMIARARTEGRRISRIEMSGVDAEEVLGELQATSVAQSMSAPTERTAERTKSEPPPAGWLFTFTGVPVVRGAVTKVCDWQDEP